MLRNSALLLGSFLVSALVALYLAWMMVDAVPSSWCAPRMGATCGIAYAAWTVMLGVPILTALFFRLYRTPSGPAAPVRTAGEVPPPWIAWPLSEPWSFKQGDNEAWLLLTFLPFWRALAPEERASYLLRFPPPEPYWRDYLLGHWR